MAAGKKKGLVLGVEAAVGMLALGGREAGFFLPVVMQ
jgi:hypothetical protein